MLSLSVSTVLLMALLTVGVIVLTEVLKKQGIWKDSMWNIPGACLVTAAVLLIYELIAAPPFTVADGIVIVATSLLIGCAAGGLYKMAQAFKGE